MIWKAKQDTRETRTRIMFAWMPVRIGDSIVWLERYEALELNNKSIYKVDEQVFEVKKWTEIARRLI